MTDSELKLPNTGKSKRAYQQPELQVYGDLRDITQTVGPHGTKDGSGKSVQKTGAWLPTISGPRPMPKR